MEPGKACTCCICAQPCCVCRKAAGWLKSSIHTPCSLLPWSTVKEGPLPSWPPLEALRALAAPATGSTGAPLRLSSRAVAPAGATCTQYRCSKPAASESCGAWPSSDSTSLGARECQDANGGQRQLAQWRPVHERQSASAQTSPHRGLRLAGSTPGDAHRRDASRGQAKRGRPAGGGMACMQP